MDEHSLYTASVPVFQRYLDRLTHLLDRADAYAQAQGLAPEVLLEARLAPEMLNFNVQVEIAAQFALRACAPLAGLQVPPFGQHVRGLDALRARIARSQDFLAGLTPAQMAGGAQRSCSSEAGDTVVTLDGAAFLSQYALPNFFFHLTSAYAILRHLGVPLGKGDFDGFHVYPST